MSDISELLWSLGIGNRYVGHKLIVQSVLLALDDETMLYCLSRRLYPAVAQTLACNPCCIERNIRTAIAHVWLTNANRLIEIAGYPLSQPPAVKEFLDILIAHLLRRRHSA